MSRKGLNVVRSFTQCLLRGSPVLRKPNLWTAIFGRLEV
jgi:hypothetical protein